MDRTTQLEQALGLARELLAEYQRRHEASEQSWAKSYGALEARVELLEARLRAFEAFNLPGTAPLPPRGARPAPLDAQEFTDRLQTIIGGQK
jgi:hypothetical protein